MTENKDAAVRPPVAEIREVFVECETAMAKFGETKKQADHRAWKRKGSVLEVVSVGHMRNCLDYIEYLETIAPPPAQDAMREHPSLELCVQFSDDGQHIRKWSRIPFDGGTNLYSHPTPQPESVEAAVERVTYAIILGSSGERAADHAKEFQTANWEDARRSAIAVIKAMPAENTQPGPGSWVPADQFVALRHERDGLRAALAEAIEALGPFASFAATFVDDEGWNGPMNRERIRDWFGPSDLRRAAQVVAKHGVGR